MPAHCVMKTIMHIINNVNFVEIGQEWYTSYSYKCSIEYDVIFQIWLSIPTQGVCRLISEEGSSRQFHRRLDIRLVSKKIMDMEIRTPGDLLTS